MKLLNTAYSALVNESFSETPEFTEEDFYYYFASAATKTPSGRTSDTTSSATASSKNNTSRKNKSKYNVPYIYSLVINFLKRLIIDFNHSRIGINMKLEFEQLIAELKCCYILLTMPLSKLISIIRDRYNNRYTSESAKTLAAFCTRKGMIIYDINGMKFNLYMPKYLDRKMRSKTFFHELY